jgi:hypothetical protein
VSKSFSPNWRTDGTLGQPEHGRKEKFKKEKEEKEEEEEEKEEKEEEEEKKRRKKGTTKTR